MNCFQRRPWKWWFDGRQSINNLPQSAVMDCSERGADASVACTYWVTRLQLDAPSWLLRDHLRGYGCWDESQLCDHQENLRRLIWIWANDCREEQDIFLPVYLGN